MFTHSKVAPIAQSFLFDKTMIRRSLSRVAVRSVTRSLQPLVSRTTYRALHTVSQPRSVTIRAAVPQLTRRFYASDGKL